MKDQRCPRSTGSEEGRTWKAVWEFVDGGGDVPLLQTASPQLVHWCQQLEKMMTHNPTVVSINTRLKE